MQKYVSQLDAVGSSVLYCVAMVILVLHLPVLQIKKVQVDRDELFEENESQACKGWLSVTCSGCSCELLCYISAAINLNHEPELEEGWEQLQRKVSPLLKV